MKKIYHRAAGNWQACLAFFQGFPAPAARKRVFLKKGVAFMRFQDEVMVSFVRSNFKSTRIRNIIRAFRIFNLYRVCRGVYVKELPF